ncbi:LutB/LldF family L-lactate oxidation iron-sulfur protein [Magnetospira sp. QH-2]|uniref:LutB/LldF family L-lactate oxidation iron-sulfur protein n=1 Tax=Magnetospira sp. (strain QH-2) TaxID=1288970 RepID=UPI0003E81801|nr:LutB/LldF family L-lactate oxidation iron-sulfur protein [Magnetospira sp. QH-2]CCQ74540.1 conserved protein of unknown function,similar to Iron-sulphur protein [Magnetospira sp. QH-2]
MAAIDSDFRERAKEALADPKLRANLRKAMDGLMAKRAAQFPDAVEREALRDLGQAIRRRALAKLPQLLQQLESKCQENGIRIHWTQTPAEANAVILGLIKDSGATFAVKGKSMATEEIHLNQILEEAGVMPVESDLGEYIIQLAEETPSHIVMPCIHKNTPEIAQLFHDKIEGAAYTEDPAELTAVARGILRDRFAAAGVGLSGVNMAVAETGTLVLVENEGNGRLSTTVPDLHIAVMGIEKVVETLEDVPPLLSLLTRSATGQPITTYVNMITGPRKPDEMDGPRAVHLVLIDNGRSRAYADPILRQTLQCIRCGACINHCPVYTRVGGQVFAGPYPGPIGQMLAPQLEGLKAKGDLPTACSLCNACVEVCPVRIPIAKVLVRLRGEAAGEGDGAVKQAGSRRKTLEVISWKLWGLSHASGWLYRMTGRLLTRFGHLSPMGSAPMKDWVTVRARPTFAKRTFHELMAKDREEGS